MTLWLLSRQHVDYSDITTPTRPEAFATPSTIFKDVEVIVNSAKGTPQYILSAPAYWLYPEQRRTEFELPNITIHPDNGGKISATALRGQTHNDDDRLTLVGNVRINQAAVAEDPHRYWFEVTADNMTLSLNTRVIHLHGNVEGYYAP